MVKLHVASIKAVSNEIYSLSLVLSLSLPLSLSLELPHPHRHSAFSLNASWYESRVSGA